MSGAPGLTRRTESLLRALRTRHGRRDSEHCFCDGLRASREVVTLAPDLVELVILRDDVSLPFPSPVKPVVLPAAEFDRIAPTVHSQGILVLSRRPEPVPMDVPMADPFALVLDRVGDPGNFGTILRTARAVGDTVTTSINTKISARKITGVSTSAIVAVTNTPFPPLNP